MNWIIVIIFIIGFLVYVNGKFKNEVDKEKSPTVLKPNKAEKQEELIKSAIKDYDLVGIHHQKNANTLTGSFFGTALTAPSSFDKFSVVITNNNNQILGYVPKGNHKLFKTIEKLKQGEAKAFGEIYYNDFSNYYSGYVNILLNVEKNEEIAIIEFLKLKNQNDKFFKLENPSIQEYFVSFENFTKMDFLFSKIKYKSDLYLNYPTSILPRFSKKLEADKDWENILKLEKYEILINELTEVYKNSILKRIEKAKSKINI